MASTKKIVLAVATVLLTATSFGQVTSGRIVFERKVNLKKMFGDNPQLKRFLQEGQERRIEQFEMYFTDSSSAFFPIESDEPAQGFMKYLTTHNTIYKNLNQNEKVAVMDMWGTETHVKDSITEYTWKITDSKRKIGGYMCRKAFWEMNDSTRIYAWFSVDVVPSTGPEGFGGLPGTILGLATENGSIIYFAKEVEAMEPPKEKMTPDLKGKDVFTQEALKKRLLEKMGQWVKADDLDAMFSWL